MSRLDSFLRRLEAQRGCLNRAAALLQALPGPVFELGLGNGRTYDHLCELFPEREIYVFERRVSAHPSCIPDADHLFEGDLTVTLAEVEARFTGKVALVHADLGSGQAERDTRTAALVAARLPAFLAPAAVVVSDMALGLSPAEALSLPAGVQAGRYYMYRWPQA